MDNAQTTSKCLWPYAIVDGIRKHIDNVERFTHGECPVCGSELIAKKGPKNAHHWAHARCDKCDAWYQPKGPWHLMWQNLFPEECREVVIDNGGERHIADIKTANDIVVEVQWSSISTEDIAVREKFYNKMLWIVGAGEASNNKRLGKFIEENVGVDIAPMAIREISFFFGDIKWLHCSRPVFVDISGTLEGKYLAEELFYIMPSKNSREDVYVCKVTREGLIEALLRGETKPFFQRLKDAKAKFLREKQARKAELEAEFKAENERMEREANQRRLEKAKPFLSFANTDKCAIAFANHEFHYPPRCALTLGWVEAFLIVNGALVHVNISPVDISIAPYGRVAIHMRKEYTRQDYERDCVIARNYGIETEVDDYETLQCFGDKIIACADYLVKQTKDGLLLTFACPYRFLQRDSKAFTWDKDKRTFWALPQKTQEYLSNVDIDSKMHKTLW